MKRMSIIVLGIVVLFLALIFVGEEFLRRVVGGFAGSYPYAETWELNAKEADVIGVIMELKREDKSLQPPNQTEMTSKRDTSDKTDYWLFIDFFYMDTKQVVHTCTRPSIDSTHTTFALDGFSNLNDSTGEKTINKDFWYFGNRREINKFQTLLVDRIKDKLTKRLEEKYNIH